MVTFVELARAKELVRKETVVFAEVMDEARAPHSLEVHVMRPGREGLYEVERDDTGPVPGENVRGLVERVAMAHGSRYATIYPAEERWPPSWASMRKARWTD